MALQELLQQDRRLVVLRILNESPGYESNDSILDSGLGAYGHNVSRDLVRAELYWLQEQGLITLRDVASTVVAKITQRGIDVATGQATHPGVKRPRPGE
ncbi:ArsR family transcriptional regulator [Photobacterium sp. WH24]|uniref:VpaChn25_0724 family phage protein n=1 Tax=Photobacterium TaxID=657 RepID=UPI001C47F81D|nr:MULTISPECIES: ArsR family transcriptional regulator [Photobacterium]MBV7262576.1 ArsR family transcriptional regulator [Photobacterium sp. WH24]